MRAECVRSGAVRRAASKQRRRTHTPRTEGVVLGCEKPLKLRSGQRPPCGFKWSYGIGGCGCVERPYKHACSCVCGRPWSEHERYVELRRTCSVR